MWVYDGTEMYSARYYHTKLHDEKGIVVVGDNGICGQIDGMIHNKNGWTREFPPVEDEDIERIEFENVIWDKSEVWPHESIPKLIKGPGHTNWGDISDATTSKPPMKMILEIPKEETKND